MKTSDLTEDKRKTIIFLLNRSNELLGSDLPNRITDIIIEKKPLTSEYVRYINIAYVFHNIPSHLRDFLQDRKIIFKFINNIVTFLSKRNSKLKFPSKDPIIWFNHFHWASTDEKFDFWNEVEKDYINALESK